MKMNCCGLETKVCEKICYSDVEGKSVLKIICSDVKRKICAEDTFQWRRRESL